MSSTATAATARQLTATAKAAAPGARLTTTSQGPYSYRTVLHTPGALAEMTAAGLAAHAIAGIDGGSRFTATWGRDRRTGLLVITTTDETAREAEVAAMQQRRNETMARELGYPTVEAYLAAPGRAAVLADPELSGEIRYDVHGARYWTAEEIAAERAAAAGTVQETTVEHWGPDAVAVTREYDAPAITPRAALVARLIAAGEGAERAEQIADARDALQAELNPRGARVTATAATRGFRAGATGTVTAVDPEDGALLVEWDDSQSGPSWADRATVAPAEGSARFWIAQENAAKANADLWR